jgi:hypothetical protein
MSFHSYGKGGTQFRSEHCDPGPHQLRRNSPFERFQDKPHPTGKRGMGRCTDLVSSTLGRDAEGGGA